MNEELRTRTLTLPDGSTVQVVVRKPLAELSDEELVKKLPVLNTINERWAEEEKRLAAAPVNVDPKLVEAMQDAKRLGLQSDLRVLADRLRNEAPAGSPDFNAGIAWAVRFLENTASGLTN